MTTDITALTTGVTGAGSVAPQTPVRAGRGRSGAWRFAVLVLLGALWILQGLDVLGGSGMSGNSIWAVIGLIVGAVGVFLVVRALRTPSAGARP